MRVYGIQGQPKTSTYKVSASYNDGYKWSATLVYAWPGALVKAKKAAEILENRAERLGLDYDDFRAEFIGANAITEQPLNEDKTSTEYDEIQLRISVSGQNKDHLNRFGKEVVPLILTGPSGVTGFAGGRPKSSSIVAFWPALLKKEAVEPQVRVFN